IGLITGLADSGVAAGVRRLEALTGRTARKHANSLIGLANQAAQALHGSIADMPARATALIDERKKLERELSDAKKKLAMGGGGGGGASDAGIKTVGDIKLMAKQV